MKAIVLAYHNIGCAGIKALVRHGIDITAIFTHRDDPAEAVWFDSVAELASNLDIPVFAPDSINHPLWVERIRALKPDILFSFYYRDMVNKEVLDVPPNGCLNLHGSLLPRYRGRCPINWVLVNGESETGVTLHYMTPRPDDGDIVGQRRIPITDDDTALSLHRKAASAASALLDDLLPGLIDGSAPHTPQDKSQASYFDGRRPVDGKIDWNQPAATVRNLVRAVTRPYPGAFSHIGNRQCFFWSVCETNADSGVPGTILSVAPLTIKCGRGAIEILSGQCNGSITHSGSQLAEELGLVAGMRFGGLPNIHIQKIRKKCVLILGINGFIGNHLSERLLASGRYEVHGMDLNADSLERLMDHPDFHFLKAISPFTGSGSSTMCANAISSCRSWPSPPPSNMYATRCGSSSWISKRTYAWCVTAPSTASGLSSLPLPKSMACAPMSALTRITLAWYWVRSANSAGSTRAASSSSTV